MSFFLCLLLGGVLNHPLLPLIFHHVSQLHCFLSSLHCRCSSCFCSAGKASSGFRSGTCLCLIRRKRRSPESWCRQSWLENPKCAASWSGGTSRLCTRGGQEQDFVVECAQNRIFHCCLGNSKTCHSQTQLS